MPAPQVGDDDGVGRLEGAYVHRLPEPGPAENRSYTEEFGFPEYLIGPTDELKIKLAFGTQETEETVVVRPDGRISFELVHDLEVAGLTPREVDDLLTESLIVYLKVPKVDVLVDKYNSRRVALLGAIQTTQQAGDNGPGVYSLTGKKTVLDIILEAGGPTDDAQLDSIKLTRGSKEYIINLNRIKDASITLEGGDLVRVPGLSVVDRKVLVIGEVRSQGVFSFPSDVSVMEAVIRAGGFTNDAVREDIKIIRGDASNPQMFSVDAESILENADLAQNIILENNDILYVPRSFISDINVAINKINPILSLIVWPSTYRDLYTTGGGLRIDTGPPETGTTTLRTLPIGKPTAGAKAVADNEKDSKEKKTSQDE